MQWSLKKAAAEFGVSRETLKKRLTIAEIPTKPTYSTKEICRAVFGDLNNERLRLTREQADKLALENEQTRKIMAPVTELIPLFGKYCSAARARIDGDPKLDREEKDKIIEDIGKLLDVACGLTSGAAPVADPAT